MTSPEQPSVEPLSAEEVRMAESNHWELQRIEGVHICSGCRRTWPCPASRALATIRARDERIARLEEALKANLAFFAGLDSYDWYLGVPSQAVFEQILRRLDEVFNQARDALATEEPSRG